MILNFLISFVFLFLFIELFMKQEGFDPEPPYLGIECNSTMDINMLLPEYDFKTGLFKDTEYLYNTKQNIKKNALTPCK